MLVHWPLLFLALAFPSGVGQRRTVRDGRGPPVAKNTNTSTSTNIINFNTNTNAADVAAVQGPRAWHCRRPGPGLQSQIANYRMATAQFHSSRF